LSDFSESLQDEAEWHADKGNMTKTANFENPKWRTAAILKSLKRRMSVTNMSDSDEILCAEANIDKDGSHFTKIHK